MTLIVPAGPRTLTLPAAPLLIRGNVSISVPPVWPSKDPVEIDNYAADFFLAIEGRQTLAGVNPTVIPAGAITILDMRTVGTIAVFRFSGGTDGQAVKIGLTATLSDGQVIQRVVVLPIIQQIEPSPPDIWMLDFSNPNNSGAFVAW